jgi:Mg-chelatase subunit ChlD
MPDDEGPGGDASSGRAAPDPRDEEATTSMGGAISRTVRSVTFAALLALVSSGGLASAQGDATPGGETETTTEGGRDVVEATEGGAVEGAPPTVNVELVLDSSGSMAEETPDGETKIDAAKRALREVIAAIPARNGYNVGLRVYGQEGSNREEDRAESCRATELLVPIEGVDEEALREGVAAVEPTGWTPLARALEAAGDDFAPGGEGVTNAVIMVTDGEETCGGDPCEVAGALHAADVELTTHVVGFGLTPEQREAVRCIAEEGGGELFAAADAEGLSEAVFSALEQLEPTVAGYVGGNAFPLLEAGESGELSIVAVGPYQEGLGLPIVVRNDTGEDVEGVEVSAVARDADGGLLGQGSTNGIYPYVVVDGGLAFGRIYFGVGDLPDDAEYEDVEIEAEPRSDEPIFLDMTVEEAGVREGQIVGIVRNDQGQDVSNLRPAIACFDEAGELLEVNEKLLGAADTSLEVGDETTVAFTPDRGAGGLEGPCLAFLFAAQAQEALP